MAYSSINNGIKQETTTHFHNLLHAQLSAEDSRNIDNNDSAEESGESPLDFSIKRKSRGYDEVSGSDSVSSSASSLNDTIGHIDDRKSDNDVFANINNSHASHESPQDRSSYFHHKQHKNEHPRREQSSIHERIGQNKTSEQSGGSNLGLPDMLHDLQMGIANANMIANTFPAMAALMEHRQITNSPKCSRPFKAYPNDSLSISLENRNLTHYLTSLTNFENSAITRGLNLSADEVFSIYKQQIFDLMERKRHIETLRLTQEQYSVKTSTMTTSSPSTTSTWRVSDHVSGKNFGRNSNLIESILNAPSSSSRAATPPSPGQHSNTSNCSSHISINSSLSHLPSTPSLTAGGRRRPRSLPDEQKDEAYWERRRKNNEAAKRSRDARRAKEDQIGIRAALLEQENLQLRVEIASLKTETAKLRCRLYNT